MITSILKSRKIAIFQRCQSMVLGRTLKISHLFIQAKKKKKKCLTIFFAAKKAFLVWFWSKIKNFPFFIFCERGKQPTQPSNVFDDILHRKNAFQTIKTLDFFWIFPKGLVHAVSQKFQNLLPFLEKKAQKVCLTISASQQKGLFRQ